MVGVENRQVDAAAHHLSPMRAGEAARVELRR